MYSLSEFISHTTGRCESATISTEEVSSWLPMWFSHCQEYVSSLGRKKIILPEMARMIANTLKSWERRFQPASKTEAGIVQMNELHAHVTQFIAMQVTLNPGRMELIGGYPHSKKVSGVALQVRLVLDEKADDRYTMASWPIYNSAIGRTYHEAKQDITDLRRNIGSITWLTPKLKQLGFKLSDAVDLSHPHAEAFWFVDHVEDMISQLQSNKKIVKLPSLIGKSPVSALVSLPRIEFVTSSSCCHPCRKLFASLRLHLNDLGINIPIVFYADIAYNATSVFREIPGSVYTLNHDGHFVDTHVQCDTPHASRQHRELPASYDISHVSTQNQRDYNMLCAIGGLVIMDFIKSASSWCSGVVHPFTYIAPDSLIIFAAQKLAEHKSTSKSFKRELNYLNNALASIDLKLLGYWRLGFVEYLHWLLLSLEDPVFREKARDNSGAARMSSALWSIDEACDSPTQRFFLAFRKLWKRMESLEKTYDAMLDYFTENNHARMPLGMAVGPISYAMAESMDDEWRIPLLINMGRICVAYDPCFDVDEDTQSADEIIDDSIADSDPLTVVLAGSSLS